MQRKEPNNTTVRLCTNVNTLHLDFCAKPRRRRKDVTRMKRVMIAIALAAIVLFTPAVSLAQKLVFVVRHAERADTGMQAQTDPPLSAAGESRAQKLAAMLADAGVKDVFATEFKRTQARQSRWP